MQFMQVQPNFSNAETNLLRMKFSFRWQSRWRSTVCCVHAFTPTGLRFLLTNFVFSPFFLFPCFAIYGFVSLVDLAVRLWCGLFYKQCSYSLLPYVSALVLLLIRRSNLVSVVNALATFSTPLCSVSPCPVIQFCKCTVFFILPSPVLMRSLSDIFAFPVLF